jgi:hypothetical protein
LHLFANVPVPSDSEQKELVSRLQGEFQYISAQVKMQEFGRPRQGFPKVSILLPVLACRGRENGKKWAGALYTTCCPFFAPFPSVDKVGTEQQGIIHN